MILFYVLLTAAALVLFTNMLLCLCWGLHYRSFNYPPADAPAHCVHTELKPLAIPQLAAYPPVAVLLAVRNEAHNLQDCLDHLLAQDYPAERYAIWIGNDDSTDQTWHIAQVYAEQYPQVHLLDIREPLGAAQAKANVLAHLVQASRQQRPEADCLLVTDADTRPPCHWMRGMVQSWQTLAQQTNQPGIVTGTTLVAGTDVWAQLQRIDWLYSLGMVKVASDLSIPTATLGNNHMMSRSAYEATGGYERLPFSITEDFQMLHAITSQGFSFGNVLHPYVVNFTLPTPGIGALIAQRKRWMQGAWQLPKYLVGILMLQDCFYPVALGVAYYHLTFAGLVVAGKVLVQSLFIILVTQKLRLRPASRLRLYFWLLPYDLYIGLINFATLIYQGIPAKIRWKDRSF